MATDANKDFDRSEKSDMKSRTFNQTFNGSSTMQFAGNDIESQKRRSTKKILL